MHLTLIHDIQGNIASIVVSPPDSPVAYLETQPGQQMTEIEMPDLTLDQDNDYIRERLWDLKENHIVVIENHEGRLAKKPDVEYPKQI